MRAEGKVDLRALIRASVIGMVIVGALGSAGCESELTDKQHIARAKELAQKGDVAASVIELRNALQRNSNNVEARWLLGNLYLEIGNVDGAEKELRRALELKLAPAAVAVPIARALLYQGKFQQLLDEKAPNDLSRDDQAELLVLRAQAWMEAGNREKAAAEVATARKIAPDTVIVLFGEAFISFSQGNMDAAEVWARQALEKSPLYPQAWSLLGDVQRLHGQLADAEVSYTKAGEGRRTNFIDVLKRAETRVELGRLADAKADLKLLLSSGGAGLPQVHYLAGLVAYRENRIEEARTSFQEALRLNPRHAAANLYLGTIFFSQRNYEISASYLETAASLLPNMFEAARQLAALYFVRGKYAEVESRLRPFAISHGDDPQLLKLRGEALMYLGQTAAGVRDLRRVTEMESDSAQAHLRLGMALVTAGEREEGLRVLDKAIALDPRLDDADVAIVLTNLRTGALDAALVAAKRWRDRRPDNAEALRFIGAIQVVRGDIDNARQAFEAASKNKPNDPVPVMALADLDIKDGKIDKAKQRYQEFLGARPNELAILMRLAAIEGRQGNWAASGALLQRAVDGHPDVLAPRLLFARLLISQYKPEQALSVLRDVGERFADEPQYLEVLGEAQLTAQQSYNALTTFERLGNRSSMPLATVLMKARAYEMTGDMAKTREALGQALKLDPGNVMACVMLSQLAVREGKLDAANEALKPALAKAPDDPAVQRQLAHIALSGKRPDEAVRIMETSIARARNAESVQLLSQAQAAAGQLDAGRNTLQGWLDEHPSDLRIMFSLSEILMRQGQVDTATVLYRKILEASPNNVVVLNNLALALRERDPAAALIHAQRAVELVPDSPVLLDTLGTVLAQTGDVERAIRVVRQARDKTPQNPDIALHLAQLLVKAGQAGEARRILRDLLAEERGQLADATRHDARSLLDSL